MRISNLKPTLKSLKRIININSQKKFHRIMNIAYLKLIHGLHLFFFFYRRQIADVFAQVKLSINFDHMHSARNIRCERWRMREWHIMCA